MADTQPQEPVAPITAVLTKPANERSAYLAQQIPAIIVGYEQLATTLYGGKRAGQTLKAQRCRRDRTVPPPSGRCSAEPRGRVYWLGADLAEWLEIWCERGEPPTEEELTQRKHARAVATDPAVAHAAT